MVFTDWLSIARHTGLVLSACLRADVRAQQVDDFIPRADQLTVRRDTGGNYRMFTVHAGTTISIAGLSIADGFALAGGGIYNAGTLTLDSSTLFDNVAIAGGFLAAAGGSIYNQGVLTVSNSTLSDNTAFQTQEGDFGGGIANDFWLTRVVRFFDQ